MKLFLWMAAIILFAIAIGFSEAKSRGIPITAENIEWETILLVPLLVLAWWLSRPRSALNKDKAVEKAE